MLFSSFHVPEWSQTKASSIKLEPTCRFNGYWHTRGLISPWKALLREDSLMEILLNSFDVDRQWLTTKFDSEKKDDHGIHLVKTEMVIYNDAIFLLREILKKSPHIFYTGLLCMRSIHGIVRIFFVLDLGHPDYTE